MVVLNPVLPDNGDLSKIILLEILSSHQMITPFLSVSGAPCVHPHHG